MRGLETPPRTIMEVFKMLPEGTLAELINGTLYMSPAPNTNHQRLMRKLTVAMSTYVEEYRLGEIFFSPYDVYLDEHSNAVQPDIIFISSKNSDIIKDAVHGAPDLIIEILSPGNPKHDMVLKKELYQQFGVREYWIIIPDTKESTGFTLQNGIYTTCGTFTAKIKSIVLNQEFSF
jgi:Uma2 family endonuclease